MGKIRCVRIPTREMERFFTRRTLAHARGNIIIRARFQRCYPRCLFHRVATKKASSSKYIYIYTERVTHVEKERRLELRGGGGGAATCLNLVNKPVRMFPPRATSEVLLLPTYLSLSRISFSLWRLARHLASHDPHLLCPAHCPARPLKSPRLFLASPSRLRSGKGGEGGSGRLEEERKDGSRRSLERNAP